jgi:hypothetical protein
MLFTFVRIRNRFKGWVCSDFPIDSIAELLGQSDDCFQKSSVRLLKDEGKNYVIQQVFEDRAGKRWDMVVKRVRYNFPLRRFAFLFFTSPAYRSLRGALLLKKKGFPRPHL